MLLRDKQSHSVSFVGSACQGSGRTTSLECVTVTPERKVKEEQQQDVDLQRRNELSAQSDPMWNARLDTSSETLSALAGAIKKRDSRLSGTRL